MRHLLAVLALALSSFTAFAQQPQCQPPDAVVAAIATSHPVEKMIPLDHEQTARVAAWWDAQPPESEDHFDLAIVLKHTQHETGLLLGRDGKVCKAVLIPDDVMPALLAAIMGTHASGGASVILVQDSPAIHHHEGMSEAVDRFYSSWFQPANPNQSCCNKMDCYPTEARMRNGHWEALQRETGNWIKVPAGSIEHNRDGPDSLTHVCMQASQVDPTVYCFILGGGT